MYQHVELEWGFRVAAKWERGCFENPLVLGVSVHSQEATARDIRAQAAQEQCRAGCPGRCGECWSWHKTRRKELWPALHKQILK